MENLCWGAEPMSPLSAASIPKDKSFGARATVTKIGGLGRWRSWENPGHIIFSKVFFFNHEASFWVCISQLFEYSYESWSVGNRKLVWRRTFITQIRDPIYVGSLRPERGNFLTLILTDSKQRNFCEGFSIVDDLPRPGPIFDTGCLRHLALRLSPSEQSQRRSRLWILGGAVGVNGCNHGMLTSISWNMGPQNLWLDMMISAQNIS